MYVTVHCRLRTVLISFLTILITILTYFISPWFHAAWIWRESTTSFVEYSADISLTNRVPQILHQTWRDRNTIPLAWQQASNSCRSLHPNYEYHLWTDVDARRLMEKEFPCLLDTYDSYPYSIQRADVIRLLVLYVFGGIYLDLDIVCLKPLDSLLTNEFVLPRTMPVGLSNDFIIAEPRHPFLLQVLNDLPKFHRSYLTKYPTVMFSTGPMFLTYEASHYENRSSLKVLSQELYGKYIHNASQALFRHLKASSWHGHDAAVIKWAFRWRNILVFLLISIFLLIFALIRLIQHYHILAIIIQKYSSMTSNNSKKRKYYQPNYEKLSVNTAV